MPRRQRNLSYDYYKLLVLYTVRFGMMNQGFIWMLVQFLKHIMTNFTVSVYKLLNCLEQNHNKTKTTYVKLSCLLNTTESL